MMQRSAMRVSIHASFFIDFDQIGPVGKPLVLLSGLVNGKFPFAGASRTLFKISTGRALFSMSDPRGREVETRVTRPDRGCSGTETRTRRLFEALPIPFQCPGTRFP